MDRNERTVLRDLVEHRKGRARTLLRHEPRDRYRAVENEHWCSMPAGIAIALPFLPIEWAQVHLFGEFADPLRCFQCLGAIASAVERRELGDCFTAPRDDDLLAALGAVDEFGKLVLRFKKPNLIHGTIQLADKLAYNKRVGAPIRIGGGPAVVPPSPLRHISRPVSRVL